MQEQKKASSLQQVLFTSWWLLLLFLIVPVFIVVNLRLHLPVNGDILLYNNAACVLFLALRFGYYLVKLKSSIRYGAGRAVPKSAVTVNRPAAQLHDELSGAGFTFDAAGRYGEKRDLGYLGTVLFYGGLMVLLFFGSYDYMREYSIMVRTGVGLPVPMDGKDLVGEFEAGFIARPKELPQLQIKKQILPNKQWPKGATEIALVDKEGKELSKSTVAPGKPYVFDGLEYHMIKFVFDALIVVREGKYIIFDEFVKFVPMAKPKDGYTYYAPSLTTQSKLRGDAWLNPEKKTVRIIGKLGGKTVVDTELALWGQNVKVQGEYKSTLEGLGHWSEIRVARERHRGIMAVGGVIALLGVLLRLLVRPQRVWLEEAAGGSRVRTSDVQTARLAGAAEKA